MEKVKVAVVGCGMISPVYLRNMKELFSILDVVAVCNRTREKAVEAAEKFGIPKVLTLDEVAGRQPDADKCPCGDYPEDADGGKACLQRKNHDRRH